MNGDLALLPARLHGEVLDLFLEPLLAQAAKHGASAAHSFARQVGVAQTRVELRDFKGAAEPQRVPNLCLLEHLLPIGERLTLVALTGRGG